jgi:hypothetical protein
MNLKWAVVAALVALLGYALWHKHTANVEAAALAALTDEHGFVDLAQPQGADPKKVWVIAAVNCPKEGARRADELARDLDLREIAFERRSNVNFSFDVDNPDLFRRINDMMNGEVPIVFVNGRIKANPELEDVIAEYKAAQL